MSNHPWAWRWVFLLYFIGVGMGAMADWENATSIMLNITGIYWLLLLAATGASSEKESREVGGLIFLYVLTTVIMGKLLLFITFPTVPLWPFLGIITAGLWASAVVPLTQRIRDWWQSRKASKEQQRREAEEARRNAERDKLVSRITKLTRADALTQGFLTAIERLTNYVPEQGKELIEALTADVERYQLLSTYLASANARDNEVRYTRAVEEIEEIQVAARRSASKLTEAALEALQEIQEAETERDLGDKYSPRLTEATKEFEHYLEGLRQVRTHPRGDELKRNIQELEPSSETLKIPVRRSNS